MTVEEAARKLNLGASSVYALVASRKLLCYRHEIRKGGRPRIDIAEHHLRAYLASVETSPPDPEPAPDAPAPAPGRKGRAVDWMAEMERRLGGGR